MPSTSTLDYIPPSFHPVKTRILSSLSQPPSTYSDLSPKGSVDAGIKDLIDSINKLPGIVTTSSCAGRVSIFLEGRRVGDEIKGRDGKEDKEEEDGNGDCDEDERQVAVPGGKGRDGKWLFVSHEKVSTQPMNDSGGYTKLFGLEKGGINAEERVCEVGHRFVRFQFEPMILHILCASLSHARPVLAAAINAGFRESGVQSLKNLDDVNAFPMVAVRTSGLALASLIGVLKDEGDAVRTLVDENYLKILVGVANERFGVNEERIRRFSKGLLRTKEGKEWEDVDVRRERKKAEGLKVKEERMRKEGLGVDYGAVADESVERGDLFDMGDPSLSEIFGDNDIHSEG